MSEKNDRPKPPTRRTSGRSLGGAKKTTPPPPPPTAELTPEQFAAEQAPAEREGQPVASAPHAQPARSIAPIEASSPGPTNVAAHSLAQSAFKADPSGPAQELAPNRPAHPAVASKTETESAGESVERQVPPAVPAPEPAAPAVQPTPPAEYVSQNGPTQGAEMALHQTVLPLATSTAFPVRGGATGPHYEHQVGPDSVPRNGTPWAQGPGRPKDIPEATVVLNQRIIARESLDASVPAALKLKKRIKRFALDNELDHLPMGDIVSVALDEWLTTRGF
ncbi:hypothetical protein [Streptomyces sp. NPDC051997]|uniref:hypothetical protein n=1 Tax=Streptomyces sp. NPDC051997 TaxID=3155611 RepID=UPI00343AE99F